jgi:heme-degrading monooxygenase HmoA
MLADLDCNRSHRVYGPAVARDVCTSRDTGAWTIAVREATMLVRMSTAVVREGREADFRRLIVDTVAGFPGRHEGLLGHEVLCGEGERTLIYLSRWRDEQALESFAGPGWRTDAVVLPGEDEYLEQPLRVSHFTVATEYRAAGEHSSSAKRHAR